MSEELMFFFEILGETKCRFKEVPHYTMMDVSGLPIFPEGSVITTEEFKIKFKEVEKEYPLKKLRYERDELLKDSDWTQCRDLNLANDDVWISYRQALRDLPQTTTNFNNIEYPHKPK